MLVSKDLEEFLEDGLRKNWKEFYSFEHPDDNQKFSEIFLHFSIIFCLPLNVFGNLFVVIVMLKEKKLRKCSANFYIIAIAITDIIPGICYPIVMNYVVRIKSF